jgi:TrmH family RNA methyltransferase
MAIIESVNNPRVKNIIKLGKAGERKKQNKFIIEGYKEIRTALAYGVAVQELFFCPELAAKEAASLNIEKEKIVETSPEVFSKISYRDKGDGFLAVADTFEYSRKDIEIRDDSMLLVLENIEKPGNLGAIIRTALAVGVETLILNEMQTDLFNPNVIRASLGGVFGLKTVNLKPADTVDLLKKNNISAFVTSTHAQKNYWEEDYNRSFALVLGSEDRGVSDFWKQRADSYLHIPMQSEVSSLNVSVAGAVIMYEAFRQKNVCENINRFIPGKRNHPFC